MIFLKKFAKFAIVRNFLFVVNNKIVNFKYSKPEIQAYKNYVLNLLINYV